MKHRNFDFHKFATISMVVVGVGFFLFSLILYIRKVENLDLDNENRKTTQLSTSRPVTYTSHTQNRVYNELLDEQDQTRQIDEASEWLDSLDSEKNNNSAQSVHVDLDNKKRDETSGELNVTFDQQRDARRELAEGIAAEAWEEIPILVEEWKEVMAQRAAHSRVQPSAGEWEKWAEMAAGFTHQRTRIEHKIIEYAMKYHGVYPEEGAIYLPDGKIAQLTEQVGLTFTDGSD